MEVQHFHTKLPCQKLMLRQIERGVQNGPSKRIISATDYFTFFQNLI